LRGLGRLRGWGGPLAAGLIGGLALDAIASNGYYNSGYGSGYYGSGYGGCYRAFVPVGHRGYYRRVVICN
jgi:hypothetical protein